MSQLPDYDELPSLGHLDIRHARDVLPHDRGTLSFIAPEHVQQATTSVREGTSIGLSEPYDTFEQPLFNRPAMNHRIIEAGRNELEEELDTFNPQAYSQLDGLAHVRAREYGFFGGATADEARESSGIHHWAQTGIVARGVLLDVHADRLAQNQSDDPLAGSVITPEELTAVAQRQGVTLRQGDIVLIRTGWLESYRSLPNGATISAWNGLHAGEETARFLWNQRIALVGADNPAVECAPGDPKVGSLHRRLLPALGMTLMELLRLDELAAACARRGHWDFLMTVAPLPLHGAVSSPASAIAVV